MTVLGWLAEIAISAVLTWSMHLRNAPGRVAGRETTQTLSPHNNQGIFQS